MLSFALTAALLLPLPFQDDEPEGPPKEVVDATLEHLEHAFAKGEEADRLKAVDAAAQVVAPEVVAFLVKKGLDHREEPVRRAAIGALGFMDHEDALDALHAHLKRNKKKLAKEPEVCEQVIKAIGRHADPSSVPILAADVFAVKDADVVRARILSLGNVRVRESVEELFSMMRVAGRQKVQNHMEHFRTSLMVLTGVDKGVSQDEWTRWWNDNKKEFEVRAEPFRLPRERQQSWDTYWGRRRQYTRGKKRGERGNDPEDDD